MLLWEIRCMLRCHSQVYVGENAVKASTAGIQEFEVDW